MQTFHSVPVWFRTTIPVKLQFDQFSATLFCWALSGSYLSVPSIASLKSPKNANQEGALQHAARVLPSGDMVFNWLTLGMIVQAAPCLSTLSFCFPDLWPVAFLNLDMPCLLPFSIDHQVSCHRKEWGLLDLTCPQLPEGSITAFRYSLATPQWCKRQFSGLICKNFWCSGPGDLKSLKESEYPF